MALPNLLSLNFLVPFVAQKLDFSRAIRGLRGMPRRLLLVGYANGSNATTGSVTTVTTLAQAQALYGRGSMLAHMWEAAYQNAGYAVPIDCLQAKVAAGATASSWTLTVAGTCTLGGTIPLRLGGRLCNVTVATGDTSATVAASIIAALNADPDQPVTAAAGGASQVVLTMRCTGLATADLSVRTSFYPGDNTQQGITVTFTTTAGTGDVDVSGVVTALADYRATEIAWPFTSAASMTAIEAELDARWQAANMQDGQLCCCFRGSESSTTTWLAARKTQHVHAIAAGFGATSSWVVAAAAAAAIEAQAAVDPAMPMTGVKLAGVLGATAGQNWTVAQMANLLSAGGSPLRVGPDLSCYLLRMVTTYTTNAAGMPDRSMAELAWIKTMSYYRWMVVSEFQTKYQGYKLAQYITDPIPGQKVMTAELGQEIMLGLYKLFCDAALCQNPDYYESKLVVEVDGPNGKLKIQDEPVLVTQHYQTEVTSYAVAGAI